LQVGQKRPQESEEPTSYGQKKIDSKDNRVRPVAESMKGFPDKCRAFRLANAAAAGHAEDCFWMWRFWNEDPEKYGK
jgi:hypothetical protein